MGYLFNMAPMGIVGGDLLKVVMLAHHQKGGRARALASVFVGLKCAGEPELLQGRREPRPVIRGSKYARHPGLPETWKRW